MAADGSVLIEIIGDASKFTGTLNNISRKGSALIGKGFAAATAAITTAGAASINVGMSFESSMSQVAATMGLTSEEIQSGSKDFETLQSAAKEAGATTAFSATESAEALNYLALAGYDAQKAADVLPSVLNLASAGCMDLASASDMVTDSMSALGIEATKDNVDEFGDKMAKTASKANTSVEQLGNAILTVGGTAKDLAGGTTELNTCLGLLADNGIKGSEGGTALRNMMLSLEAPTDKAAGWIDSLGVKVFDSGGKMRSMQDIMSDLNSAMKDMTDEQKTKAISAIFNKVDLKSVNALLGTSTERWNKLSSAIDDSKGAMQDMAEVQLDNLEGDITILKSGLEGLGIAAYERMKKPLRDAAQTAIKVVEQISRAFSNGAFDDVAASFSDTLKSVVDMLLKVGGAVGEVAPAALKFVSLLADGIGEMANHIDVVIPLIAGLSAAFKAAQLLATVNKITTTVLGFSSALISPIGLVVAAGAAAAAVGIFTAAMLSSKDTEYENVEATEKLIEKHEKLSDAMDDSEKAREEEMDSAKGQAEQAQIYADKLSALVDKENKSAGEKAKMADLVEKLNGIMPDLNLEYDKEKDKLNKSTDAIQRNVKYQKDLLKSKAAQKQLTSITSDLVDLEMEHEDLTEQRTKNQKEYNIAVEKASVAEKNWRESGAVTFGPLYKKYVDTGKVVIKMRDAYDETSKAVNDNEYAQQKLNDEYEKTEKYSENIVNSAEIEKSLSSLTAKCKRWGVEIPEAVSQGITDGRYAIPAGVKEMNKLISFDEAISAAGLSGTKIPDELADGVYSGSISVSKAIEGLKNLEKFDEMTESAKLTGIEIPDELRSGIATGKISVEDAVKQLAKIIKKNAKADLTQNGKSSGESYGKGLDSVSGKISTVSKKLGSRSKSGVKSGSNGMGGIGSACAGSFASGVGSKSKSSYNAGSKVGNEAKRGAKDGSSGAYSVGFNFTSGLANGIAATAAVKKVQAAARAAVQKATKAAQKAEDSHSPAKIPAKLVGVPFSQGIAVGITKASGEAADAARNAISSAVDSAETAAADGIGIGVKPLNFDEVKAAVDANLPVFAARAQAAVQFEMSRVSANLSIKNAANNGANSYDDARVLTLLRQVRDGVNAGQTMYVNENVLGSTDAAYRRKMRIVTGGAV